MYSIWCLVTGYVPVYTPVLSVTRRFECVYMFNALCPGEIERSGREITELKTNETKRKEYFYIIDNINKLDT